MSLKEFITTSCGKEIYLDTKKLQQEKIRNARAKNQMVFLYKCLSNNVTPKSFRLRAPIKTTKYKNIMKELRRKLLTHAWNETKRRLHQSKNRITNICSTLCQVLSPKITRILCELMTHQKMLSTKKNNVIWKKNINNWKMKTRNIHRWFQITNVR